MRIALVNDYEVVLHGLEAMLAPYGDRVEVVELAAGMPVATQVDVTLYDTFSQPQADADEIDSFVDNGMAGAVVVYTWNMQTELVDKALDRGCRGYLGKSLAAPDLVAALEKVDSGDVVVAPTDDLADPPEEDAHDQQVAWPGQEHGLSEREAEVVALITQGLTNKQIAARTWLSINTVKTYIRTAYRKIGVQRRAQAVRWGMEHGMLPSQTRVLRGGKPVA